MSHPALVTCLWTSSANLDRMNYELKQLATNRDGDVWRQHVRTICPRLHVHVQNNNKLPAGPKCDWVRKPSTWHTSQSPAPDVDTDVMETERYRKCDTHKTIFRSKSKPIQRNQMERAKETRKCLNNNNKKKALPGRIRKGLFCAYTLRTNNYIMVPKTTTSGQQQCQPQIHHNHRWRTPGVPLHTPTPDSPPAITSSDSPPSWDTLTHLYFDHRRQYTILSTLRQQ